MDLIFGSGGGGSFDESGHLLATPTTMAAAAIGGVHSSQLSTSPSSHHNHPLAANSYQHQQHANHHQQQQVFVSTSGSLLGNLESVASAIHADAQHLHQQHQQHQHINHHHQHHHQNHHQHQQQQHQHHQHHSHHFNGHDNGPILYTDTNRTSAIDDIRSVVIYIFIITIFLSFFLILPGIRSEKFPTFLCITSSLIVTSIIIISLFGTTWHVGEAPILAAYKAFSRDRIQGHLSVRIGLQSVNISLVAHKYYLLHASNGPMIMENMQHEQTPAFSLLTPILKASAPTTQMSFIGTTTTTTTGESEDFLNNETTATRRHFTSSASDTSELEVEEVFQSNTNKNNPHISSTETTTTTRYNDKLKQQTRTKRHEEESRSLVDGENVIKWNGQKYTVKRVNIDINYNERFYWIGPVQMRQEYHQALERGLPYPILTVVEYLSQDDAGFNWSRQYRAAGYYTSMSLWFALCVCVLMFCLHCTAPKHAIYTMQFLGLLLLFTNLTYATLVPKGDKKLVIPFEGQSLSFQFGWNFWLVLVGGCLSLLVGTIIVILDNIFPNFIFTTVLDADFNSNQDYYQKKHKIYNHSMSNSHLNECETVNHGDEDDEDDDNKSSSSIIKKRQEYPPFMRHTKRQKQQKIERNKSDTSDEVRERIKTQLNSKDISISSLSSSERENIVEHKNKRLENIYTISTRLESNKLNQSINLNNDKRAIDSKEVSNTINIENDQDLNIRL